MESCTYGKGYERDAHGAMRDYSKQGFNLAKEVTLGFHEEETDEL